LENKREDFIFMQKSGIEKAKREEGGNSKTLEIAQNLKKTEIDIETIITTTGLSIEEIYEA